MSRDFVGEFKKNREAQKRKNRGFIPALMKINAVAVGLFFLGIDLIVGFVFSKSDMLSLSYIAGLAVLVVLVSFFLAKFQTYDAGRNGAAFILKRLRARPPDFKIGSHHVFFEVVEEMQTSTGFARIDAYVLPGLAVNSLALVQPDGTPGVAMTEGLLTELSRKEIEAVASHEMAHIVRGDALHMTIVCSIADFIEHLREESRSEGRENHPLSVWFAAASLRALRRFVEPEREILADSLAVEMGRDPVVLAKTIFKAHVLNAVIGDGHRAYAPLYFVPPESKGGDVDAAKRPSGMQPPLMARIRRLADMAGVTSEDVIQEVREIRPKGGASGDGNVLSSSREKI